MMTKGYELGRECYLRRRAFIIKGNRERQGVRTKSYHMMYQQVSAKNIVEMVNVNRELEINRDKWKMEKIRSDPHTVTPHVNYEWKCGNDHTIKRIMGKWYCPPKREVVSEI